MIAPSRYIIAAMMTVGIIASANVSFSPDTAHFTLRYTLIQMPFSNLPINHSPAEEPSSNFEIETGNAELPVQAILPRQQLIPANVPKWLTRMVGITLLNRLERPPQMSPC